MSEWIDRIKTHQAWTELTELGAAIDQAMAREGIDFAAVDSLERIRTVLGYCGKRLASADPVLITPTPMANISSGLNNTKAAVLAFLADGSITNLAKANVHADETLQALAQIAGVTVPEDVTAISESAATYRTTLARYLKDAQVANGKVKSEIDTNLSKLEDLASVITAEKGKIATSVADFQTQFQLLKEQERRNL